MTPAFVQIEAACIVIGLALWFARRRFPGLTPISIAFFVIAGMFLASDLVFNVWLASGTDAD